MNLDEFAFIQLIKQSTYKQSSVIKGIGDDAAVFRQTSQDIVTAIDTFVEGVHFTRKTMEPFHVGYRALAANISDLAAMGATPAFYLASIVIPKTWSFEELQNIYAGMSAIADIYGLDLIGGDTVSGTELSLSITVIGYADKGKSRYRSHANDGDIVFVTGTLGDSQAGLHILTNPNNYLNADYFIKRHRMPTPRIAFASGLTGVSRVALNDVSDGIANEAAEIAEASNLSINIFLNKLPKSNFFNQFTKEHQRKWMLSGGEDFELLGTVAKDDWVYLKEVAKNTDTPVSNIGYVAYSEKNNGKVYLHEDDQRKLLNKSGYTHLKQVRE